MALITRLSGVCRVYHPIKLSFRPEKLKLTTKHYFHSMSLRTPLLRSPTLVQDSRRFIFMRLIRKPSQRELKITDNIPDEYTLIYRNTMGKYIHLGQIVATITGVVALIALILKDDYTRFDFKSSDWTSKKTQTVDNEAFIYMAFFVTLIVSMQIMILRIPMRIYKSPQRPEYVMIFNGVVPFSTNRAVLKRGEIYHLEESGILPWSRDRYLIPLPTEEKRVILIEHYFRRPADLYVMLGVQKDAESEETK